MVGTSGNVVCATAVVELVMIQEAPAVAGPYGSVAGGTATKM